MLKPTLLFITLFSVFFYTSTSVLASESASERDQWQQFRAHKGIQELDAEFDKPQAQPEVRIEVREVEKIIIKEVPVAAVPQPEPELPATPVIASDSDSMVTVESDGYIFKLGNCNLRSRNIKCSLSIVSIDRDETLNLYAKYSNISSKLFDSIGNEYVPNKITMGNKSNDRYINNQYIAGVTAKGSISFENIEKSTQSIALIDLSLYDSSDKKYKHIKFRNVKLAL